MQITPRPIRQTTQRKINRDRVSEQDGTPNNNIRPPNQESLTNTFYIFKPITHTQRQTNRQTARQAGRQAGRQTDRGTHSHTHNESGRDLLARGRVLRGLGILASEIRMWDILRVWVSYLGLNPHLGIPEMRILLGSGTETPKVGSIDEHLNASSVAEFRGLGYSAPDYMQLQGGGIVIKGF